MSSHESKLLHHAQEFQSCSGAKRALVLRKYQRRSKKMPKAILLQHACHVAAWIVCSQSLDGAAFIAENCSLSPVMLLQEMLELRGRGPVTDRARAALEAVRSCCRTVLGRAEVERRKDWIGLLQSLPRPRKASPRNVALSAGGNAQSSNDCETADILMFKRIRRFHRKCFEWRNRDAVESKRVVADAEQQLFEILEKDSISDGEAVALRKLLFATIGALANPRHKSCPKSSSQFMSAADIERFQIAADVQRRVRKLLVKGLTLWRKCLQLEDMQILPILNHLHVVLEGFEKKHMQDVRQAACAGKQWHRLKMVLHEIENLDDRAEEPVRFPSEKDIASGEHSKRVVSTPNRLAKQKSSQQGGFFEPNDFIQALPNVYQSDKYVKLHCSICGAEVSSNWFVTRGEVDAVLRPCHGHQGCAGSKLLPADHIPSCTDRAADIDRKKFRRAQ